MEFNTGNVLNAVALFPLEYQASIWFSRYHLMSFGIVDKDNLSDSDKEILTGMLDDLYDRLRNMPVFAVFMRVDKPMRLELLYVLFGLFEIPLDVFSKMLVCAWVQIEFPHQTDIDRLVSMFNRADPNQLMDDAEMLAYGALPPVIQVYRGVQTADAIVNGLSWTTDLTVAKWFANRWVGSGGVPGDLYSANIARDDVYCYLLHRSEYEIILNPEKLRDVCKCQTSGA